MIKYYLTKNGKMEMPESPVKDCWISMIHPTEKELKYISELYNIEDDDIRAALDEDEATRITKEDDYTIIIVDIPTTTEEADGKTRFITLPMSVIFTKDTLITVCLESTPILNLVAKRKDCDTKYKTRLLLQILFENAKHYLKYLKQINKQSEQLELILHSSIENSALLEMMQLGRALLYFMTSLKGNSSVLEKLTKASYIVKYEDDEDLLEDVMIESKQAMEMAETYSGVINGTMDGYASVISNNMNMVQKFLATASVIIAVPSIIFDFFGMNLLEDATIPLTTQKYATIVILAVAAVATYVAHYYLKHKKNY
ncbi:MAG: magnesium transporter CorA family protein [Erysipelotrichaceae bacterium]|nr:magnesium transporter CorA family protein [Erysipelotrichaceae bacterium]